MHASRSPPHNCACVNLLGLDWGRSRWLLVARVATALAVRAARQLTRTRLAATRTRSPRPKSAGATSARTGPPPPSRMTAACLSPARSASWRTGSASPTVLSCNLYPYEGEVREQPCTLVAANSCNMDCRSGVNCIATCGDDSEIACGRAERCEASVGDNAGVGCWGAELCDIECRDSCEVHCPEGRCTVSCADPEECLVMCSETGEATLCPDGETKVCAIECPGETPT